MQKNLTENACRVCLSEKDILINVFDEVEDFKTKISDLLEYCGDLKVDLKDNYPKLICGDCTSELIVAAKFREKCKRTREILSQFISTESELDIGDDDSLHLDGVSTEPECSQICYENDQKIDYKNQLITELPTSETKCDEEDCKIEIISSNVFENIEFLETNENAGQYIIVDEETDGDLESRVPLSYCSQDEENQNQDENVDQFLYDRIVNAAYTAVKCNSNQQTIAKPLKINCKCEICGAGFTHLNNLKRHLQKHSPRKFYNCSICTFPFISHDKLKEHEESHEENKYDDDIFEGKKNSISIKTEDCHLGKNSKTEDIFLLTANSYSRNAENKEIRKNHKCNHCEKRFVSKSALSAHLRIHTGDRPFECSKCSKTFTTQGGLVLHMRRHTGLRPFSCNVCGKRFVESSNLKVHMRIHTGEKPHKCTICGRNFARVFLLQIHQRTHTGERPYQCPYCEKAFAQQGDLSSHKRIHTGERPHQCIFCTKGFIKSSALTQHMRKHSKFEDAVYTNQTLINSDDTSIVKKEENDDAIDNYDILIVEEHEVQHPVNIIANRMEGTHQLDDVVECPSEVIK